MLGGGSASGGNGGQRSSTPGGAGSQSTPSGVLAPDFFQSFVPNSNHALQNPFMQGP